MPDENAAHTPTAIRQTGPDTLSITWLDGHESAYPVRTLRLACGCAHCVDEWTGAGLLEEDSVPADVRPLKVETVGRYALQIQWSDGHETGIYPYRRLRELDAR